MPDYILNLILTAVFSFVAVFILYRCVNPYGKNNWFVITGLTAALFVVVVDSMFYQGIL